MFFILPMFLVAVLMGVQSWAWKAVLIVIVGMSARLGGGPIASAVSATLIVGIGIKNSLAQIRGSSMPKIRRHT